MKEIANKDMLIVVLVLGFVVISILSLIIESRYNTQAASCNELIDRAYDAGQKSMLAPQKVMLPELPGIPFIRDENRTNKS